MPPSDADAPPPQRPTPMVQIGRLKFTGAAALLVMLAMLGGLVALVVWARPNSDNWPMWISGGLWVGFIVYWSSAARNSAPTAGAESNRSRGFHELLLDTSIALGFIRFAPIDQRWLPEGGALIAAGLGVQLAAGLLAAWARRHLGRNWSGRVETKVGHRLVRTGPYRILRHPIYTGMLGMIAGTALVSGEWHGLLAVTLMAITYARKIRIEERRMRETFGAEWEAWRSVTWALVPGVV
jgi:protein-S-isoprenylcysteine O-methyltransferase Ste14